MRKFSPFAAGLVTAATVMGLFSLSANAVLISQDLTDVGTTLAGGVTFDTDTNLEWLDSAPTLDQSFNDVIAGFTPTGWNTTTAGAGFRYATTGEVSLFFSNAGATNINGDFLTTQTTAAQSLLSLVGCTFNCGGGFGGVQSIADTGSFAPFFDVSQFSLDNTPGRFSSPGDAVTPDFAHPLVANWLVRESTGGGGGGPTTADIDAINAILQTGEFINLAGDDLVIPFETVGGTGTVKVLTIAPAGQLTNNGVLTNEGVVNAASGTLQNNNEFNNERAVNINAGDAENTVGSTFNNDGIVHVRNGGTFTNDGTLNITGLEGIFTGFDINSNALVIDGGGTLDGTGTITQTARTVIVNGTLTQDTYNLDGGILKGTGAFEIDMLNIADGAIFAPGTSPGTFTINGDVDVEAGAIIQLEIGNTPGESDFIQINGLLSFQDGVIFELVFSDDFNLPDPIDIANFFSAGVDLGSTEFIIALFSDDPLFDTVVDTSGLSNPTLLAVQATSQSSAANIVNQVPEPGTLALLGIGLAGLGAIRRRRKAA